MQKMFYFFFWSLFLILPMNKGKVSYSNFFTMECEVKIVSITMDA